MTNHRIEELEHKYLNKFYYFLKYVEDEMLDGFQTKEKIRDDWEDRWDPLGEGKGISSFSIGAERIVYALLNGKGVGQPNSAPIGSDIFFEVHDAFIHFELKTVQSNKIKQYTQKILVSANQNSYNYEIKRVNDKSFNPKRYSNAALPHVYYNQGRKKPCLTYFITILYEEESLDILNLNLICMPNGQLSNVYKDSVLTVGKVTGEVSFKFLQCSKFLTLSDQPFRMKVIYINPQINEKYRNRFNSFFELEKSHDLVH